MRCKFFVYENEDGLLPIEVELLVEYVFHKEVKETRGSYSGDTPGEPAYIEVTGISVTQVRLNDHGLMLHDKRWLTKLFDDRFVKDQAFVDELTSHCEEDYTERTAPCDDDYRSMDV